MSAIMTNSYTSIDEAKQDFKANDGWKFTREYFRSVLHSVAICKKDGYYFIITHPDCVRYRQKENQVVEMIY